MKSGDAVSPKGPYGPREEAGCADQTNHVLRRRPGLVREVVVCRQCGGTWARKTREVDRVRGELRETPGMPYVILHPGARARRSSGPSRGELARVGVLDAEGALPQTFEELNRRKREAEARETAAELYRRRGRR